MPAVSYDSLSFLLDGARTRATRLSISGAAFDATLIDPVRWGAELARLRHAGFNTVVIRLPWALHEPTPDRFVFEGACDVRTAVRLAGAEGLRVILRIGPCVGGSFARGGLPGWLRDRVGPGVREASPEFLARVTKFWRAVAPQFVDLQATRTGGGEPHPVIAVGIEDDWRCLDGDVGEAYFGALVRYAREIGINVPLVTANNGWYTHEGAIDAWRGAVDIARTAGELRQLRTSAPPVLLFDADVPAADVAAQSIAARADFVCEVLATRHVDATAARGCAEIAAKDLFPMRRSLVFAPTFADHIAGMLPVAQDMDTTGAVRSTLEGAGGARLEIVVDEGCSPAGSSRGGKRASRKTGAGADAEPRRATFEARGSGLAIGASRLEHCSGSLVALLGDIVVVAGAARSKVSVKVDGSTAQLTVPADGGAPKLTKVRALRIALVTNGVAEGVGIAADAIEFVDRAGALVARIARDGSVARVKTVATAAKPGAATDVPSLGAPMRLVEAGYLDGTHPRFARVVSPASLGAYGIESMHGFYAARFIPPAKTGHDVRASMLGGIGAERRSTLLPARAAGQNGVKNGAKNGAAKEHMWVLEARVDGLLASGGHRDERMGAWGPIEEIAPLKGVKAQMIEPADVDATRIGRFAWGYDVRGGMAGRRTVRWTFAARDRAAVVRFPERWTLEGHDQLGHALRLNGELLDVDLRGRTEFTLDGTRLAPMRPAPTPKGEKPAKGRNIKYVPGENELVIDPIGDVVLDEGLLRALAKETEFLDVVGGVDAGWSFARVEPPSSWSLAEPIARRAKAPVSGAPTWFRWTFALASPADGDALELVVDHPADSVATILVNGAPAMVLDGASGARQGRTNGNGNGTGKRVMLRRTLRLSASMLRAGENEIVAFEPDGEMPLVSLGPAHAAP
ncbi:MAG: beta-galactosidase [Planctomycetaceae bacterium]|nr:beta-galactosidase [Planctomycetaceae bacterium]